MQTAYIDELKKNPKAVLDDVSVEIEILANKINALTSEVAEEYFSETIDEERGRIAILGNHKHFAVIFDVVKDYVFELKKKSEELETVSEYVFDILKNIEVTANA